jgi:hypothetical protein
MSSRSILQFIFLLAIFGGVPVVSWYYLQTGLDYRLKALDELSNLGSVQMDSRVSFDNRTLSASNIKGKVHVGIWFPEGIENADANALLHLDELHEQFKSRSDISFFIYTKATSTDSLVSFVKMNKFLPSPVFYFFPDMGVQRIYYFMKPETASVPVALVDTSGNVRKHYNLVSGKELTRLTEHLAMILPIESTRDELIFKRDKEK